MRRRCEKVDRAAARESTHVASQSYRGEGMWGHVMCGTGGGHRLIASRVHHSVLPCGEECAVLCVGGRGVLGVRCIVDVRACVAHESAWREKERESAWRHTGGKRAGSAVYNRSTRSAQEDSDCKDAKVEEYESAGVVAAEVVVGVANLRHPSGGVEVDVVELVGEVLHGRHEWHQKDPNQHVDVQLWRRKGSGGACGGAARSPSPKSQREAAAHSQSGASMERAAGLGPSV